MKAEQLGRDYWLGVVTDAIRSPSLHAVLQDPAHRLAEEVVPQVRDRVSPGG